METQDEAWALDVREMDVAGSIEAAKHADLPSDETPSRNGTPQQQTSGETVDVIDELNVDEQTINEGVGEAFDGIMKIASGSIGQDLTPTEEQKKEAAQKLGPLVQKRMPKAWVFSPEGAAVLWFLGYLNEKIDWT